MSGLQELVLVTGATGVLGSYALPALMELRPNARFMVITRGRLPRNLDDARIDVVTADLRSNFWSDPAFRNKVSQVTHVVHMAADVRWNAPEEDALNTNAIVTEQLVSQIESHATGLEKFVYVSTAFSTERPLSTESQGLNRLDRRFSNTYEYSKFVAERAVQESRLPWMIVRPSIIVGRSNDGGISKFSGIYPLLKAYARGLLPIVVGYPNALVDIVPIDVVVEAVLHATFGNAGKSKVVYAISGDQAPTVSEVVSRSISAVNQLRAANGLDSIQVVPCVPPERFARLFRPLIDDTLSAQEKRVLKLLSAFEPYFAVLEPMSPSDGSLVLTGPRFDDYFDKCLQFWCSKNENIVLGKAKRWAA